MGYVCPDHKALGVSSEHGSCATLHVGEAVWTAAASRRRRAGELSSWAQTALNHYRAAEVYVASRTPPYSEDELSSAAALTAEARYALTRARLLIDSLLK